jgi:hypothetical protein
MLFLFSDAGPHDAPTRIKVGSHLDVPPFLEQAGDAGRNGLELCKEMDGAGKLDAPERPLALATGEAGDVYLCHPFLIHAAQAHRGTDPRFLAQPPLDPAGPLELDRPDGAYSPVEIAVRRALGHSNSTPDVSITGRSALFTRRPIPAGRRTRPQEAGSVRRRYSLKGSAVDHHEL